MVVLLVGHRCAAILLLAGLLLCIFTPAAEALFSRVPMRQRQRGVAEEARHFGSLAFVHARLRDGKGGVEGAIHLDHRRRHKGKRYDVGLKSKDGPTSLYVGEVAVGSPPEIFSFVLDTGSTNFWVSGLGCGGRVCKSHKRFNTSSSSSFEWVTPASNFDVTFGTGHITGRFGYDDVTFGSGLSVPHQLVGVAQTEDQEVFDTPAFSGIVGLAYPELADSVDSPPVFDSIANSGVLDRRVFAFWMKGGRSEFHLGGMDESCFTGDLDYFDVVKKYYWEIPLIGIKVGDDPVTDCDSASPCVAVVDSGTTFLSAPSSIARNLIQDLEATCINHDNLLPITYILRDSSGSAKEFTLDPKDYMEATSDGSICKPQIMPMDVQVPEGDLFILGDTFMKKFYTVFDRSKDAVGIARAAPSCGSGEKKLLKKVQRKLRRRTLENIER